MARGFGATDGAGTTDKIVTLLDTQATLRSYALWTYRHGDGGNNGGRIFDRRTSGVTDLEMLYSAIVPSGTYRYQHKWSGSAAEWTVVRPSADAWHHLVVTYNAGATTNIPVIYIDGITVTVSTGTAAIGSVDTTVQAIGLGNRGSDNARVWDGRLAEFAAWDAILDADEAQALGLGGYSPLLIRPASLVAYEPMLRDNVSPRLAPSAVTGTAIQPHPRVVYPRRTSWSHPPSPVVDTPVAPQMWLTRPTWQPVGRQA